MLCFVDHLGSTGNSYTHNIFWALGDVGARSLLLVISFPPLPLPSYTHNYPPSSSFVCRRPPPSSYRLFTPSFEPFAPNHPATSTTATRYLRPSDAAMVRFNNELDEYESYYHVEEQSYVNTTCTACVCLWIIISASFIYTGRLHDPSKADTRLRRGRPMRMAGLRRTTSSRSWAMRPQARWARPWQTLPPTHSRSSRRV